MNEDHLTTFTQKATKRLSALLGNADPELIRAAMAIALSAFENELERLGLQQASAEIWADMIDSLEVPETSYSDVSNRLYLMPPPGKGPSEAVMFSPPSAPGDPLCDPKIEVSWSLERLPNGDYLYRPHLDRQ